MKRKAKNHTFYSCMPWCKTGDEEGFHTFLLEYGQNWNAVQEELVIGRQRHLRLCSKNIPGRIIEHINSKHMGAVLRGGQEKLWMLILHTLVPL